MYDKSCFIFQLEVLNIGNNLLEDLPEALIDCIGLLKLHAFSNKIYTLNPKVLCKCFMAHRILLIIMLNIVRIIIIIYMYIYSSLFEKSYIT